MSVSVTVSVIDVCSTGATSITDPTLTSQYPQKIKQNKAAIICSLTENCILKAAYNSISEIVSENRYMTRR